MSKTVYKPLQFTDSVFYEIELTAKYCKMLGAQVFKNYGVDIQTDEFAVLDTLSLNNGLCQRDIAKLILKDRANTGKILESLEKKGFIKRNLNIKNNRPVKIIELTDAGLTKRNEIMTIMMPHLEIIRQKIQDKDLVRVIALLKEFRAVLDETLEIQI